MAFPPSGLHTNGYSLVRRVFARDLAEGSLAVETMSDGTLLADALMAAHRCYLPTVGALLDHPALHALSHITGGGIEDNTLRVVPKGLQLDIDWQSWPRPELFRTIQERGGVEEDEMRRVFNLGIGVIAIVAKDQADDFATALTARGERVIRMGRIVR